MADATLFSSSSELKYCSKCGFPAGTFREKRKLCVECHKAYHRAYYKKNKAKFNRQTRTNHLRNKYGLTQDQFEELRVRQGGRCAVCLKAPTEGRYRRLNVDHDHKTGAVRGLLCWTCNASIGKLGDDPEILERAASYLRGAPPKV